MTAIKLLHTAVWALLAGCILSLPVAAFMRQCCHGRRPAGHDSNSRGEWITRNINVALRRAEGSLARATEILEDVKRAHAYGIRQEQLDRPRELEDIQDHVTASTTNTLTEQQANMRALAGLGKHVPPVVGTLDEQQMHERCLAGLPVKPAASITVRPSAFFAGFAQEVHARLERLDKALLDASQTPDRKVQLDLPGYPAVMSAAEIWSAIENLKSELRNAARP